MIITIHDYLKTLPINPFIGKATEPAGVVSDTFQDALESYIALNYYSYRFINPILMEDDTSTASVIRRRCDAVYAAHAYTYQTLFDSMNFDYDPISNYDMVEQESIENGGVDKTKTDHGSHTDSTSIGEHTDSTSVGAHTDSFVQGESTLTDTLGARTRSGNNTADKAPFNSQSYQNLDKGTFSETDQSAIDSHRTSSRSDSATIGGRTDSTSFGGREDKVSYGSYSDTDTTTHGHTIDRKLTRKGNIGTMTTQQMIQQQREIAMLNLVAIVANDIISALCVKYKGVSY